MPLFPMSNKACRNGFRRSTYSLGRICSQIPDVLDDKNGCRRRDSDRSDLGFLIGLVVVSQTIYANTMENIEEYATLKALGAPKSLVARVVLTQALLCGTVGSVLGLFAVIPVIDQAKSLIPWIYMPWWLPVVMVLPSMAMCSLASIASVRNALTVEPGRCSVPKNHLLNTVYEDATELAPSRTERIGSSGLPILRRWPSRIN